MTETNSNASSDSEWEQYDEKLIGIQLDRCKYTNTDFERFSVPHDAQISSESSKSKKEEEVDQSAIPSRQKNSTPNSKIEKNNDTAERGAFKVIGLESKTPILAVDQTYYLAERIDSDKSVLVFTDPRRGDNENVKLGVRKVDAMFTASGVTLNEYPDKTGVKKSLIKKDNKNFDI